ncbi:Dolichyl-diphosphooligosaccharide--protein glycotransferase [Aphelenchoides fujianensis]|nr:Dolichyl-diphosphooligosaccharide--protein glycotransferase [Aphelenchoides fujianensis]
MADVGTAAADNPAVKNAKLGTTSLLTFVILALAWIVGFSSRLFSVIRFESIIHEFDPWFNYRSTAHMVEHGVYDFINWFDERAWYPLGRIVGGTVFPGLMFTSGAIHYVLHLLHFPIHIREVCVFLAPFFSGLTAIATYLLTKELWTPGAGLFAACFMAIVPGYVSRSVAGSYDNEGIAIFALQFTYFLWVRAVRTGSITWAIMTALAYFYMCLSWGGFVYICNLLPLHALVLIATGRYSHRLYVAYTTFYCVGQLLAMQIPFIGYQPVGTSEHMAAFGVFGLLQLVGALRYARERVTKEQYDVLFASLATLVIGGGISLLVIGTWAGVIAPWTGRLYSLFDTGYAKIHIPIIASVSEHQPTTWGSYFFDLQLLVFTFPVGLYYCFTKLTDLNIFIITYAVTSIYFSGVMVRLMLVLSPVMCVLGGIAVSEFLSNYYKGIDEGKKEKPAGKIAYFMIGAVALLSVSYVQHCIWVTSEAYSSPSIVLAARGHGGSRIIFDDFREAYWWLRQNTDEDAKIASWWDYGYQLSGMANRTVLVDNNTWNNTHISRVGQAMASDEDHAMTILEELDVDYVLVIFGGMVGYQLGRHQQVPLDDQDRRIDSGRRPHPRTVSSVVVLLLTNSFSDYFTKSGEYRVDKSASPTMLNSLMYKLSYYKFGSVTTEHGRGTGFDRVRGSEIGVKDVTLKHLEEAFTSEHWLVRIYRTKKRPNRV